MMGDPTDTSRAVVRECQECARLQAEVERFEQAEIVAVDELTRLRGRERTLQAEVEELKARCRAEIHCHETVKAEVKELRGLLLAAPLAVDHAGRKDYEAWLHDHLRERGLLEE